MPTTPYEAGTPPQPADLSATPFIDADHPEVKAFAARFDSIADPKARAVATYYAVRDDFRYDPYHMDLSVKGLKGSGVLATGSGWCVNKAILLAAVARASGIPARVGFADVKNHLSTERMRERLKTDVFMWHGYTSLWIDGQWVKATPAFNLGLCQKFRLKPLEFDGREDSIYHAFDETGQRHMEYLRFRGDYSDVPLEAMLADFRKYYASYGKPADDGADFDRDVEKETK